MHALGTKRERTEADLHSFRLTARLLDRQPALAIEDLLALRDAADPRLARDVRWQLAQCHLLLHRADAARAELELLAASAGAWQSEARQEFAELARIK